MRKALVIGIDQYPRAPLNGCVRDAEDVADILALHGDGAPNFKVNLQKDVSSKNDLARLVYEHFRGDHALSVLYFSGHGSVNELDGYLVTPDYKPFDPGLSLSHVMHLANESKHLNRVIILDCCHAGSAGVAGLLGGRASLLHSGVTVLAASKPDEAAMEADGHGIFTGLLLQALDGGAADICGNITPAGVYSYIDQALGALDQRPVFKTNTTAFIPLRMLRPEVPMAVLRNMVSYFRESSSELALDPSYEFTNTPECDHKVLLPLADPVHVGIFKDLQRLEGIGLVAPVGTAHMYFAAMESRACRLTPLGRHYWRLLKENKI